MSESYHFTPRPGLLMEHTGVFDIDAIARGIKKWYLENNYRYDEKENITKDKPQGFEIIVKFKSIREVDDFVQFHIDMEFHMFYVEKVKKGSKIVNKGYMRVIIMAHMTLDYKNKWERSKFGRFLYHVYRKHLIRDKIKRVYEAKIDAELQEVMAIIKKDFERYH